MALLELKQNHMPLIKFQLEITNELLQYTSSFSTPKKKRGRPSSTVESEAPNSSLPTSCVSSYGSKKYRVTPTPLIQSVLIKLGIGLYLVNRDVVGFARLELHYQNVLNVGFIFAVTTTKIVFCLFTHKQ